MIENIVALRNEKGSYNVTGTLRHCPIIVALRNEKGSYNWSSVGEEIGRNCSTAK